MSNQPPLNPDALEASAAAARIDWSGHTDWNGAPNSVQIEYRNLARAAVSAYLATAQPVVNSVEVIPAKVQTISWESNPEHDMWTLEQDQTFVGLVVDAQRGWSMADKITIHIERPEVKP